MAVDLVLRLCQVDEEDGGMVGAGLSPGEPGYNPAASHIALNDFVGALELAIGGRHTTNNLKTFYNMPTDQQAQFDILWGKIWEGALNNETVLLRVHAFRDTLLFWERRWDLNLAAYDTPDDIQTWLMSLETIDFITNPT